MYQSKAKTFKILFSGNTLPNFDLPVVKKNCVRSFHLSESKVDKMFSGREITLKRGIHQDLIIKYLSYFKQLGLNVYFKEEESFQLRVLRN